MTETKPKWNWQTIAIVALVGYIAWTNWKPANDDDKDDDRPVVIEPISKVLAKCYEADRVSKIAILKGLTANEFASDQAKLEWINSESEKRRIADFQPYADRMAEAIVDSTTEKMAKALEAGR
jgi:hypothetical protein